MSGVSNWYNSTARLSSRSGLTHCEKKIGIMAELGRHTNEASSAVESGVTRAHCFCEEAPRFKRGSPGCPNAACTGHSCVSMTVPSLWFCRFMAPSARYCTTCAQHARGRCWCQSVWARFDRTMKRWFRPAAYSSGCARHMSCSFGDPVKR